MEIIDTSIPAVKIFISKKIEDERGYFSEIYNKSALEILGFELNFVQDNHSYSKHKFTLRGLHFQTPPFQQDKLVRVVRGSILDVAVDIRNGSPHFGKYVMEEINSSNRKQILVPAGFAHGVLTLEPDTEIIYKVTNYYSPQNDKGILWTDSDLAIDWPVGDEKVYISPKDRAQPKLREIKKYFIHDK